LKLKAAFYIPVTNSQTEGLCQLIEVADHAVSFIWYRKDPWELAGLAVYHLNEPLSASAWEKLVRVETELPSNPARTQIIYNVKESTLVPDEFYQDGQASDILTLLFGPNIACTTHTISLSGIDARLIYRTPKALDNALRLIYPGSLFTHASIQEVSVWKDFPADLQVVFYPQSIKLALFIHGKLQVIRYLPYQTATDAAYHLLHTARQHGKDAADIRVRLSGMIEKQSPLFNELYSYFPNILFDDIGPLWTLPEGMSAYPEHYFSHLTTLATCVS